jgi:hypothetical protein
LRFAILLACASSSHGGLTPAALVHVRLCTAVALMLQRTRPCTRSGRCKPTVENVRDCTSVSNTTAGSRPPLLCNVRSSIAKIAFSPPTADIGPQQERGASAPRGSQRAYKCVSSTFRTTFARPHPRRAHARRSCSRMRRRCARVGRIVVAPTLPRPRRAHARRSCKHAFVNRKNRFFVGRHSDRNQERGASAPRGFARVPPDSRTFTNRSHRSNQQSSARRACRGLFTNGGLTPAARSGQRSPDHSTAGSRPPLLFAHAATMCPCGANRCCADLTATTAGSRPPLL